MSIGMRAAALALVSASSYSLSEIQRCAHDDSLFHAGREEWLVLTDAEADGKVHEYISDSVWAFTPDFIAEHSPHGVDTATIRAIQANGRCESNNGALLGLVKAGSGLDMFVRDAVAADGRGHFLSGYDGQEHEETIKGRKSPIYCYRIN